ncbi:hypothetical protein EM20IM_01000 [Candidatus Methylacidiphilum infernorum]|uniref:Uncharacterized protein n=1 Tax=Candidatus Methylacidiphilum infernorum TaxID=511746 RepID=A0ABX7PVQ7_9BACT|nr:hypothetical protein [Candidatus Methylacidiphilum infernorum]QSR86982.1 hypothetical protein EM20IM_01000 [Candidatus Methylacidiphilum infernorum]
MTRACTAIAAAPPEKTKSYLIGIGLYPKELDLGQLAIKKAIIPKICLPNSQYIHFQLE